MFLTSSMLCPNFSFSDESVTAYSDKSTGLSFIGVIPIAASSTIDSNICINVDIDVDILVYIIIFILSLILL